MTTSTELGSSELKEPPKVSGGDDANGHLEELRTDPIGAHDPGPRGMRRRRDSSASPGATSCCSQARRPTRPTSARQRRFSTRRRRTRS